MKLHSYVLDSLAEINSANSLADAAEAALADAWEEGQFGDPSKALEVDSVEVEVEEEAGAQTVILHITLDDGEKIVWNYSDGVKA